MNSIVGLNKIDADIIVLTEHRLKTDKVSSLINQISKYGITVVGK